MVRLLLLFALSALHVAADDHAYYYDDSPQPSLRPMPQPTPRPTPAPDVAADDDSTMTPVPSTSMPSAMPTTPSPTAIPCLNDDSAADQYFFTCSSLYDSNPSYCGMLDHDNFTASKLCCACGGGLAGGTSAPTITPAPTAMPCVNDDSTTDMYGYTCSGFSESHPDYYPSFCGELDDDDFTASEQCCACGGGLAEDTFAPTTTPAPTAAPCVDDLTTTDAYSADCLYYEYYPSACGYYDDDDFTASLQCCACGGGLVGGSFAPTAAPSPAPTTTPVPTITLWPGLAGYVPLTDVEQHARIDLDMEELVLKLDEYELSTAWVEEAMFIYAYGGNLAEDFGAIRTLSGFATAGEAKMMGWTMYPVYYAYWDEYNYADTFITKDYSATAKDAGVAELMKKGAYQAVWMYVLHKLESAISECKAGDSNAKHSWDEGWAYYAGSLVGATAAEAASERGVLLWELAEKTANDFGTGHSTGPATANVEALAAAIAGRDDILAATTGAPPWLIGQRGESCTTVCASASRTCDQAKLDDLNDRGADYIREKYSLAGHTCHYLFTDCEAGDNCVNWGSPYIHNSHFYDGYCWGGDKPSVAPCDQTPVDSQHRRLCPCSLNCGQSQVTILTEQMTVPLVQSTIKYAWRADPTHGEDCSEDAGKTAMTAGDTCVESWAAGWAFAAAVLPQVHQCDAGAAEMLRANLDIAAAAPMEDGFMAVKTAIESTYACMGIT